MDIQNYIAHMSWKVGKQAGLPWLPFSKMKMQTILDGALRHLHQLEYLCTALL